MKKALISKAVLCLLTVIMTLALLQGLSLARSENIQIIKKSENEYMIYVSGLLNEDFEFAFSNDSGADKETLTFKNSAVDQLEDGNHIAYVDSEMYAQYFEGKTDTYLWVRQENEYKLEAEKVSLADSLSEEDVQLFNNATKTIKVEINEKELPTETTEDGVKVTRKIGTINIVDNQNETYLYQIAKVEANTNTAKLVSLANEMNNLDSKDMYEKLATYGEFKDVYSELVSNLGKWSNVEDYTIEQPINSKEGDQYIVWIKDSSRLDFQIMICGEDYKEIGEKQEVVIKETTKSPITGDSIVLFVILGIVLLLIIAVVILKLKSKKENK